MNDEPELDIKDDEPEREPDRPEPPDTAGLPGDPDVPWDRHEPKSRSKGIAPDALAGDPSVDYD